MISTVFSRTPRFSSYRYRTQSSDVSCFSTGLLVPFRPDFRQAYDFIFLSTYAPHFQGPVSYIITPATKHRNPDVGARRAVPRLGEASLAPTIDMFTCLRNTRYPAPGLQSVSLTPFRKTKSRFHRLFADENGLELVRK